MITRCPTAYAEGGETPQGPELPPADKALLEARREAYEESRRSAWAKRHKNNNNALTTAVYWADFRSRRKANARDALC